VPDPIFVWVESAVWDSLDGTICITTKWTGEDSKPVRMLALGFRSLKSAQGFVYEMGWGTVTVEDLRAAKAVEDLPY
jgi:hypothetical protein